MQPRLLQEGHHAALSEVPVSKPRLPHACCTGPPAHHPHRVETQGPVSRRSCLMQPSTPGSWPGRGETQGPPRRLGPSPRMRGRRGGSRKVLQDTRGSTSATARTPRSPELRVQETTEQSSREESGTEGLGSAGPFRAQQSQRPQRQEKAQAWGSHLLEDAVPKADGKVNHRTPGSLDAFPQ